MNRPEAVKELIRRSLQRQLDLEISEAEEELPFIQLGLDSEGAIELVADINEALGLKCSASVIFDHSSVSRLTSHLSNLQSEGAQTDAMPERPDESGVRGLAAAEESRTDRAVAIIGVAGRYPGADDLEQFWRNLEQGIDSVGEVPADRWDVAPLYDPDVGREDKIYAKWLGSLERIDEFDPRFFNMSPAEAELMDPQQRIFLQEAWKALEDAGLQRQQLNEQACGTYVGVMFNEYAELLVGHPRFSSAQALTGNANSIFAARLAYFLNLRGPAIAVDTACSSSLVAMHLAYQALLAGEIDIGIAGGVTLMLSPNSYLQMCRANMLSPDGKCKPFDNRANGFVPAEGAGVVVLKRLADAERAGDRIYGVIRGSAINQDGRTNGITAPSVQSQTALQETLYRRFSIDPDAISYVEAHGTGTKLGDPIELEALSKSFGAFTKRRQYCGVGSVKSNIGHTSATAGIAGVHKLLLMLEHKQLVPTVHFERANEQFDFSLSPFYVTREAKPWVVRDGERRRAAVSSFGFSGTNAHMVIDEYVAPASPVAAETAAPGAPSPALVVLSARNHERLQAYAGSLREYVRRHREDVNLVDLAYTLQVGRTAMEERLALAVTSTNELEEKLGHFLADRRDIEGVFRGSVGSNPGRVAAHSVDEDMTQLLRAWVAKGKHAKLLDFWVKGLDFDWRGLYGDNRPRLVSAPTYPFARERYWVDAIRAERPGPGGPRVEARAAPSQMRSPTPVTSASTPPDEAPGGRATESPRATPRVQLKPPSEALDRAPDLRSRPSRDGSVQVEEQEEGVVRIRMTGDPTVSEELLSELERSFRQVETQPTAKVVLLVGGDRQFLSGGLAERDRLVDARAHLLALNCPLPVIAVMKGGSAGPGWLLGASCDLMVCSEESAHAYLAEASGWAGSEEEYLFFQERFGPAFAEELLSHTSHTGRQLRERGLGIPVLAGREVDAHALALARRVAEMPREALILLKEHLAGRLRRCASALTRSMAPRRRDRPESDENEIDLATYCLDASERAADLRTLPEARSVAIDSDAVRLDVHGDEVAVVTLCDRRSKNTFSDALVRGVQEAFDEIGRRPDCKVVVLTGYDNHFSSGGTKESLLAIQQGRAKFTDTAIYDLPLRCEIPVIAAMQGHAVGAGWSMGLLCDCAVFSVESVYVSPYMKYGFTPGAGATLVFPEKLGRDLGHEILWTAREYKADELRQRGMKNPVLPRAEVHEFALRLAAQLAVSSREDLVELKRRSRRRLGPRLDEIYARELAMHEKCFVGNDDVSRRVDRYFNEGAETTEGAGRPRPASAASEAPEAGTTGSRNRRADADALAAIRDALRTTLARELHIQPDQLDERAQFLDLGVDSIISVTWIRKVNSELGLAINATTVYQHSTLDDFARYIVGLDQGGRAFERGTLEESHSQELQEPSPPEPREAVRNAQSGKLRLTPVETAPDRGAIAIVGMSGQFPRSRNLDEFWDNLVRGRDCITEVPSSRWDVARYYDPDPLAPGKTCSKWMGVLEDAGSFDPLFFNISPSEARWIDPQQRLFLQDAWHCIEASGYPFARLSASRCGVFVGCSVGDYGQSARKDELTAQGFTGRATSILAARIAYLLNLQGPCLSIDTACSSSLVAIASACDSLVLDNCDLALAGGVAVMAGPSMHIMTSQAGMLSEDGRCHTFDQRANGFVPGEGVGVILLKRLRDAERDGDQIHGVIRGWGVNQDGRTNGITAPNPESQTRLQKEVYRRFSVDPDDIQLIEAHGTGTKLGDPIEVEGLKASFKAYTARTGFCALGTVKSNIGHLLAAAGIAGVIKVLLALKHKTIPPTIHYEDLNEHIELDQSPFYVAAERKAWEVPEGKRRLAAVSSFGFSGTNAHLVIEEHAGQERESPRYTARAIPRMIVLSARDGDRLREYAEALAKFAARHASDIALDELAYTLQVGREPMEERLGFVASSVEEVGRALDAFLADPASRRNGAEANGLYVGHVKRDRRVAPALTVDEDLQQRLRTWIERRELHKVLQLWVEGSAIDWEGLHGDDRPRRISAPTYPFAKEHYWIMDEEPRPSTTSTHQGAERPALELLTNITCGERQKRFIDAFVKRYETKTRRSKQAAVRYRRYFSDQRTPIYFNPLLKEIHYPITYDRDDGAHVHDVDGTRRIDIASDYGVNLFGHRPPFLVDALKQQLDRGDALSGRYDQLGEAAQLFCEITGHDRVLFCQSGTESLMSALRLARAYTGKSKVVTFAGSYHGHHDGFLSTRTPGVVDSAVSDTVVLEYGEPESLAAIADHSSELAAVLVEPVQSSRIDLQPHEFLRSLRQITAQENVVLIFDEMISGFRVHPQGCQGLWGIRADLATYGKILGGGLTAGAVGGRDEIMNWADGGLWQYGDQSKPTPITYLAGTHTQNPLKMAATLAVLQEIKRRSPGLQAELNRKVEILCGTVNDYAGAHALPVRLVHFGSQFRFKFFGDQFSLTQALFLHLLNDHGVRYHLHGNCFLTAAHSDRDIQQVIDSIKQTLAVLLREGFFVPSTVSSVVAPRIEAPRPSKDGPGSSRNGKAVARMETESPARRMGEAAQKDDLSAAQLEGRIKDGLRAFVSDFLQIPDGKLDADESFANLGIDSIMSMNLIKAIRERYNVKLSPAVIAGADTLGKLSHELLTHHLAAMRDHYRRRDTSTAAVDASTEIAQEDDGGRRETSISAATPRRKGEAREGAPAARKDQEVAIIGMAVRFPDAANPGQFWRNLINKKTSIREIPSERWDWRKYPAPSPGGPDGLERAVSRWGAFVDDPDHFDPLFFNITPRDAETIDPQERIVLQESYHAVEDAGLDIADLSGSRTGVFIGYEYSGYREYCRTINAYRGDSDVASTGSSNPSYYLANRVSYTFNLNGPSEAVNVNCASSAVCVNRAYFSLLNRESDLALAGGVCLNLAPDDYVAASKLLSPDGSCRVFDDRANGYVKGEGCGIVVLKRLEDAERDGDRIYAVIKSCSQNNRGAARSLADVKPEALTDVIRTCHQRSNVAAESVDYIEVDGYATKWADAIEYEAIKRVFGESSARAGKHCGLGSLKGNIGHLEPASGIASLIKVALSLHHQQFPATISCDTVNEYIDVSEQDHPLYIVAENTPFSALARDPAAPVRAGVNSFADSGVNLHILLEEYREAGLSSARQGTDGDSRVEPHLVVLSARSEDRLRAQAERLLQFVEQDPELSTMPGREGRGRLRDLAYTLQVGREAMDWRLAVRGHSAVELASRLQAFLQGRRDVDGLDVGRAQRNAGASASAPVDAGALETLDRWMDRRDWERLSRWWVQGGQVDWRRLYGHDQPRRMSAPTYPFLARRYWARPTPEARSEAVSPGPPVSFESVDRRAEARPSEPETHALKERMKSVFSALFGIAAAEIEEDRPFFELGMNSVNVAEFVEALRKQLGISLEVSDVFNYPTFQALAAYTQPDVAVETSGGRVHGPSIDLSRLLSQVGTDQLDVEKALELLSTGEWTPS